MKNDSLFAEHLQNFLNDRNEEQNNLILSSHIRLPSNSFTFCSPSWNSTSWLDHCISSQAFDQSITQLYKDYELSDQDHPYLHFQGHTS